MKQKESLFGMRAMVLGGSEREWVKRKGARLLRDVGKKYHPAQEAVTRDIGTYYKKHLDPAVREALESSELVRSGMTPQGALTLAFRSGKKGETLSTTASRLSGVRVKKPRIPTETAAQQAGTAVTVPRPRQAATQAHTPISRGTARTEAVTPRARLEEAQTMPGTRKAASVMPSMLDELVKLCAMKFVVEEGTVKMARVTAQQAQQSLQRLDELQDLRGGELARGAGVGAAAGPAIGLGGRLISGARSPKHLARQVAADAFTGAAFGGAIPFLRNKLEREVEKEKLKDYAEEGRSRTMRRRVKRTLGL
jgi:hypothetical protein